MNSENKFEYTYSTKQQEEIEAIKKKYIAAEEDKMNTLRKLDKSTEKTGTLWGIVLGVIGTLIMGGGMSLCMVWPDTYMIPGIILGIIGIIVLSIAYPVYKAITQKQREKIAPQILALAEELSK